MNGDFISYRDGRSVNTVLENLIKGGCGGGGDVSREEFDALNNQVDGISEIVANNTSSIDSLNLSMDAAQSSISILDDNVQYIQTDVNYANEEIAKIKNSYYTNISYKGVHYEARQIGNYLWELLITKKLTNESDISFNGVYNQSVLIGYLGELDVELNSNSMRTLFGTTPSVMAFNNVDTSFVYGGTQNNIAVYSNIRDLSFDDTNKKLSFKFKVHVNSVFAPNVVGSAIYAKMIVTI